MQVGIALNPSKLAAYSRVETAIEWLGKNNCRVCVESKAPLELGDESELPRLSLAEMGKECEVIIVFGGDGTILRVSHVLTDFQTPILGINSGQLGFLTETPLEDLEPALERLVNEEYTVTERTMLRGTVQGRSESLVGLNDLVLSRKHHGRVIEVAATVDGQPVTKFVCDGILVSTPTGSTAYNLAANGPIVNPELESIILNPICPHTLTNRPLLLPPDSVIELEILTEDSCHLIADGQKKIRELGAGDLAEIKQAETRTSLIVPPDLNFYELLGSKLQWSGNT